MYTPENSWVWNLQITQFFRGKSSKNQTCMTLGFHVNFPGCISFRVVFLFPDCSSEEFQLYKGQFKYQTITNSEKLNKNTCFIKEKRENW